MIKGAELAGAEYGEDYQAEAMLQTVEAVFGMVVQHACHRSDGRISLRQFVRLLEEAMLMEGQVIDTHTCHLLECTAYAVDRDGSGDIQLREVLSLFLLVLAFRKTCTSKTRGEVLFAFADVDADGYIDTKELRSWFKSAIALGLVSQEMVMKTIPWRFMARRAFWKMAHVGYTNTIERRMSADGDSRKDMEAVIDEWCDILAVQFLKEYDKDGDNRISIDEFGMLETKLDYSSLQALLGSLDSEALPG